MAYPTVSAPYGLKPINLIGGQVFAGSTREYPIPYDYTTAIFYGDYVNLTRGGINRKSVTANSTGAVGIFLGCSYTNPVTKQKTFSQYWPGSLAAGDAVAIVCDDPDTVYKGVVCSGTTVVGSGSLALVGQNLQMLNNTGNTNTGNSANAIAGVTATPAPACQARLWLALTWPLLLPMANWFRLARLLPQQQLLVQRPSPLTRLSSARLLVARFQLAQPLCLHNTPSCWLRSTLANMPTTPVSV